MTSNNSSLYDPSSNNTQYRADLISNGQSVKLKNSCTLSKVFLSITSFLFLLIGLGITSLASYTLIVSNFNINATTLSVLNGYSQSTLYCALIIGLILIVTSTTIWIAVCRSKAIFSKLILTLFSILMISLFVVQTAVSIIGLIWLYEVQQSNLSSEITNLFNESVHEIYTLCCEQNSTLAKENFCYDILNQTSHGDFAKDCSDYNIFYGLVVQFILPIFGWIIGTMTTIDVVYLISFISACCLICKQRRISYYRPNTQYTQGGV